MLNKWKDAMEIGCTDGHFYQLAKDDVGDLWLSSWADDGSLTTAELNNLTLHEQADIGGFCNVSDSAFDSYDEEWAFAKEIALLFDSNPLTIIRAIRG